MSKSISPQNPLQFFITAVGFLFFFQVSRELLGTIYNMNLATMSINVSILAIFAFLSPVFLIKAQKAYIPLFASFGGIVLAVCRAVMGLDISATLYLFCAMGGVAGFGIFLPALMKIRTMGIDKGVLAPTGLVCASVAGAGIDLVLRTLGDTFDITIYGVFPQRFIPLIVFPIASAEILGLYAWYKKIKFRTKNKTIDKTIVDPESIRFKSYLGIIPGALFFLYLTILGYPNNAARGVGGPYWFAAFLYGLAGGGFLLAVQVRKIQTFLVSKRSLITGGTIIIIAFLALLFHINSVISIVLLALALFFLPVEFSGVLRYINQEKISVHHIVKFFLFCSSSLIIFLLCSVFSLTYSYIPGGEVFRGQIENILVIVTAITMIGIIKLSSLISPMKSKSKKKSKMASISIAIVGMCIMAGTWSGVMIYHSTPTSPGDSVVVMTYNIHQGYNTEGRINPWQLLETIQTVNPGILALQESDMNRITSTNVDIVQWLAHKLDMYAYFGPRTRHQIYGVAILSRYPLRNTHTYFLSSIEDQRVLVHADITLHEHAVSVYSVHLGLSEKDRTIQAQEVVQIISTGNDWKILMGDFNSQPGSPQMEQFNLIDCWRLAGYSGYGYTFDSLNSHKRIDYILVSSHFAVKNCRVVYGVYGSDHLPVWATIE